MNYKHEIRGALPSMVIRKIARTTPNKKLHGDELVGRRWHGGLRWAERQCRDGNKNIVESLVNQHEGHMNPFYSAAGCYLTYATKNPQLLDYEL